jgi:hypothetical protein
MSWLRNNASAVVEPPLPEWDTAGTTGQATQSSPDLLEQMAGPDLTFDPGAFMDEQPMNAAPAARSAKAPKEGMAFDMRRLAVQTQEEYDALEPELKDVLKLMRSGMQFTPEGVAQFVMDKKKAATPEAQAQLAKTEAQAKAAAAMAQEKQAQTSDQFRTAYEDFNYLDKLLDKVRKHSAFTSRVGWQGMLPAVPGTTGMDFDVLLDQIKGKQFMQAYQTLKGGGQITEVEGQKATDALARLNRKQSEQSFVNALDEYQKIVRTAAARAKEKLPQEEPQQTTGPAVPSGPPAAVRTMTAAEYKAATGRYLAPGPYKSKGSGTEVIILP